MKNLLILFAALLILLHSPCIEGQEKNRNNADGFDSGYVSIAGLWRCTPETALHFESITLEATINVEQKIPSDWNIQGCFMWEGRFRDYWPLSGFRFIDSTQQVTFKDVDGSVYIGTYSEKEQIIYGMVYSSENDTLMPEDKLDFERVADVSVERLFTPRVPDRNGSIQYSYEIPSNCKSFECESVFRHVNDSLAFIKLMKDIINQEYGRLESFLIMKDHKLVLEEYFFDYTENDLHDVFSCTKSVVSLLTGIALEHNDIHNMKKSLFDLFPKYMPLRTAENENLTLQHILTMSAGFKESESYKYGSPDSLVSNILCLPMVSVPGEKFRYNAECPFLLGGIVYDLEDKLIDQYAVEYLFNPLGIKNYIWKRSDKIPFCDTHLQLLPRDMIKIGMLVLNNGEWEGKQIVPEKWIFESTSNHISESEYFDYGYQWWHRSDSNESWWEKSPGLKEHDMIVAVGFGGQYIFIVHDLNLVMVTTSSDYNESNGLSFEKFPMVIERVIPLFE